jgi:hypothetical protein
MAKIYTALNKKIALLEHTDAYKAIDNVYNTQLLKELSRHI